MNGWMRNLGGENSHLLPEIIIAASLTRHLEAGNPHRREQIPGLFGVLFRLGWHFKHVLGVQWELPGVLFPGNGFSCTALLTQDKQLNKDSSALWKAQFSALTALRSLPTPCPVQNNLKLNEIQRNKQESLTQQFHFYNQPRFPLLSLTQKDL